MKQTVVKVFTSQTQVLTFFNKTVTDYIEEHESKGFEVVKIHTDIVGPADNDLIGPTVMASVWMEKQL